MAKRLKRLGYSSLFTNAQHNRSMASKAFAAGLTVDEIAQEWPAVFTATTEHGRRVLGQRYDSELSDGRKETRFLVAEESVKAAIARYADRQVRS